MLVLELSLQALAWLVAPGDREQLSRWNTGDVRVLCLSDSNTYGIWVQKSEAWPSVLQERWNATPRGRKVEVINVGFPGTTSSRVLKNLRALLDTFRPDVVFLMIGVNDWWSPPVAGTGPDDARLRLKSWLYEHVRLFRIFYMLQRTRFDSSKLHVNDSVIREMSSEDPADVVARVKAYRAELGRRIKAGESLEGVRKEVPESLQAPFEYDGSKFDLGMSVEGNDSGEEPADTLQRSLLEIEHIASRSPARLVLLTYPSNVFVYDAANGVTRETARKLRTRLLDLTPQFVSSCGAATTKGCDRYFLMDQHPNAEGHRLVADAVADHLHSLLGE